MTTSRIWLTLVALLVLVGPRATVAGEPTAGTESNLSLGAGSRGIALGGSFLADATDASAVYWNPAALAYLGRGDLALMHAPIGFGAAAQTFAAAAYPTLHAGTFAAGLMRLASGGIHTYDAASTPLGDVEYAETAFYLAYAGRPRLPLVGDAFSLGLTAKTLTQSLTPWSTTGTGLDVAIGFTPPGTRRFRAALVIEDAVAPRLRLDDAPDVLPTTLHLGGSCQLPLPAGLEVGVHAGVDHQPYLGWSPRVGLEWRYRDRLNVRLGGSRQGAAFGLGLSWQDYRLDYAYLSRVDASTHPVSLSAGFGHSVDDRRLAEDNARQSERDAALRARLGALVEQHAAAAGKLYESAAYAAALDEWKLVASLDPQDARATAGMGAAGARLAEIQARAEHDQSAAATRAAQIEMGRRYVTAGDDLLARQVWRKLLAQDVHDAQVALDLQATEERLRERGRKRGESARSLEAQGDFVAAIAEWSQVRDLDERDTEADMGLRRCREALAAASAPRPARSSQPSPAAQAAARYREAQDLVAAGDAARAVATLREALRLDPANRAAADLLAQVERQRQPLGAEDKARLRELYLGGMSYFTANEFDKAIAEWTKILSIDPGNDSARRNIEEARARLEALRR